MSLFTVIRTPPAICREYHGLTMTLQVWLVFATDEKGEDRLLGAFAAEEKAAAKLRAVASKHGWKVDKDEEGHPRARGSNGGVYMKPLDVE